jgi:two-component system, cell cycle sensor histidine kinase and response regulator CckA
MPGVQAAKAKPERRRMTVPIGMLLAAGSDDDARTVTEALRPAGYNATITRVSDRDGYVRALELGVIDAIVCDTSVPRLCSETAISLMKGRGLDLPFIVISDRLDEEAVVRLVRSGAHDFVTRQNLSTRLAHILDREIVDARSRAERRLTEEAFRQREDQFRQAQKMEAIGQLAGGVAHDFNNLLTSILGYTALLLDVTRDQPDLVADLEEIQRAGERAGALTRQLLTFSRKQASQPTTLNLNALVSDLGKMVQKTVGDDVRVETIMESSLHHVKADPSQIEHILQNLASNARDAMPNGGLLTIETKNETMPVDPTNPTSTSRWPCVTMIVTDTGCGIRPEILDRVFEPFFTTKGPGKGTGLGLSSVYGIVTQAGGVITVESHLNHGTTFAIRFPAIDVPLDAVAPCSKQRTPHSGTETILLVEDEPAVRHLVQRVLAARGYEVLEARDVADAAAIATDHDGPIHLLLSDIVMPGLSGPDLAQRIVAQRPDVRVLYMSGFANRLSTQLGALSAGVSILRKPFTPEHLVRTVRDCLDVVVS